MGRGVGTGSGTWKWKKGGGGVRWRVCSREGGTGNSVGVAGAGGGQRCGSQIGELNWKVTQTGGPQPQCRAAALNSFRN
jgi:hypothetical protein